MNQISIKKWQEAIKPYADVSLVDVMAQETRAIVMRIETDYVKGRFSLSEIRGVINPCIEIFWDCFLEQLSGRKVSEIQVRYQEDGFRFHASCNPPTHLIRFDLTIEAMAFTVDDLDEVEKYWLLIEDSFKRAKLKNQARLNFDNDFQALGISFVDDSYRRRIYPASIPDE